MSVKPLVSILIPVRNCATWIAQSVRSAVGQSWPNIEVIVLDDGSIDGSADIVRRVVPEVRVERMNLGGQNVSRNHLLGLSRGEWLLFLDADDELAPDNVEQKMLVSADADVVYGSMDTQTFVGKSKIKSEFREAVFFDDLWCAAFAWCFPNTSSVMFRREAVLSVGGFPIDVANCTDYALYFRLLLAGCRFQPAAKSRTVYRIWSATQAANEKPLRMLDTKLRLLEAARQELQQAGQMTTERLRVWCDYVLGTLRILYRYDPNRVHSYLQHLRAVNPEYQPSRRFSRTYGIFYHYLGFEATERLAAWTRRGRRKIHWNPDVDPVVDHWK